MLASFPPPCQALHTGSAGLHSQHALRRAQHVEPQLADWGSIPDRDDNRRGERLRGFDRGLSRLGQRARRDWGCQRPEDGSGLGPRRCRMMRRRRMRCRRVPCASALIPDFSPGYADWGSAVDVSSRNHQGDGPAVLVGSRAGYCFAALRRSATELRWESVSRLRIGRAGVITRGVLAGAVW